MENKQAVEPTVEKAQEGVENSNNAPVADEVVTMTKAQVDELISAAESATSLADKKSLDAENYKKGMLKYKGLLKDNGIEDDEDKQPITSKEEIAQMIRDAVKEVVPQVIKPKEDEELTIAKNKIEEMKVAFVNSKKSVPSAAGSNLDKFTDASKTEAEKFFSAEQIAEIKRKFPNADIETIYKNMPKGNDMKGNV